MHMGLSADIAREDQVTAGSEINVSHELPGMVARLSTAVTLDSNGDAHFRKGGGEYIIQNSGPITRIEEYQPNIAAAFDEEGNSLGSFILPEDHTEPIVIQPHTEVLSQIKRIFAHPPTEEEVAAYLRDAPNIFKRDINISLDKPFDPLRDAIEYGLPFLRNWTRFPQHHDQILQVLEVYKSDGLMLLSHVSKPEHIQQLHTLCLEKGANFGSFIYLWTYAMRDVSSIHISEQTIRPAMHSLRQMGQNLLEQTLEHWNDEEFEVVSAWNVQAFYDVVTKLHDIHYLQLTPKTDSNIQLISDFILSHQSDSQGARFFLPMMSVYWLDALRSYKPGSYQRAAKLFYKTLGAHLNEIADETTADSKQELSRYQSIITWLVDTGAIPSDGTIVDFGSNDGSRMLLPLLDRLAGLGIHPAKILAVDLLKNPPPEDKRWSTLQADVSKSGYVKRVLGFFGGKRAHLALDTWSPVNDLHPRDQEDMFSRFNHIADWLVIDVPVNYTREIKEYHEKNPHAPLGTIEREFTYEEKLPDGTIVKRKAKKKFTINPLGDLIAKAHQAGFEHVHIPETPISYTTAAGRDRASLVFHRISEPTPSLSQLWVGSFEVQAPSPMPAS